MELHVQILVVNHIPLFLFSYVFIPILPAALLEFLSAPTPYIMGVHDGYKDNVVPDLVSDVSNSTFEPLSQSKRKQMVKSETH